VQRDKPALKPLPAARANIDYHIEVERH